MHRKVLGRSQKPEEIIRAGIIDYLKLRDWLVKITHGDQFTSGWPDLYAAHSKYGARWIEVKNPLSYSFTSAQVEFFPKLYAHGIGVWVLVAATEHEYEKLFKPCNYHYYMMMRM